MLAIPNAIIGIINVKIIAIKIEPTPNKPLTTSIINTGIETISPVINKSK